MEERNNYETMVEGARRLFLRYDQEEIIKRWDLKADGEYLYPVFFGREIPISRSTGLGAGVNDSMILFDLFTYAQERPIPSGRLTSISGIGGIIGAGHDKTLRPTAQAERFRGRVAQLKAACEALGGVPFGKGDAGYIIPVFADFQVAFQFYDADEDFPASLTWFFDENALSYMHYETLWYVMNALLERL